MAKETLVLCDTNIIIEFYKENSSVLKKLRVIGQEHIAVSIVTAGEIFWRRKPDYDCLKTGFFPSKMS